MEGLKQPGVYYIDTESDLELKPKKEPKRVLYFSDGTLEEFSTDEEAEEDKPVNEEKQIDTAKLTWGPWTMHHAVNISRVLLKWTDIVGEKLAYSFGITSPKYYYVIQEKLDSMKRGKEAEDPNMAGDLDDGNTYFTDLPPKTEDGKPVDLDKATDELQKKYEV